MARGVRGASASQAPSLPNWAPPGGPGDPQSPCTETHQETEELQDAGTAICERWSARQRVGGEAGGGPAREEASRTGETRRDRGQLAHSSTPAVTAQERRTLSPGGQDGLEGGDARGRGPAGTQAQAEGKRREPALGPGGSATGPRGLGAQCQVTSPHAPEAAARQRNWAVRTPGRPGQLALPSGPPSPWGPQLLRWHQAVPVTQTPLHLHVSESGRLIISAPWALTLVLALRELPGRQGYVSM